MEKPQLSIYSHLDLALLSKNWLDFTGCVTGSSGKLQFAIQSSLPTVQSTVILW